MPSSPLAETELACVGIDLTEKSEVWRELALPWASPAELAYAQRFRHRQDATLHLVGRALLRTLLARELGTTVLTVDFSTNRWGKPVLPGSRLEFSISHSGNAVWVALCRGIAVGIDVEKMDATIDPHTLAEMLHPAEHAELLTLSKDEAQQAFLRCWTRKEAVIKAIGEGLQRPLASFRVRTDESVSDWISEVPDIPVAGWSAADLPTLSGYSASVAAMAPGLSISSYRLEAADYAALGGPAAFP
ncbi:MAG: 4'-phosphopantetheinyl transferase superfamily protein [Rhodocyclaceae bacterium]